MLFGLLGKKDGPSQPASSGYGRHDASPVDCGLEVRDLTQGCEPCKVVVTFHTTSDAMAFEAQARKDALPGRLTTIPRQITAGCGYAWTALLNDRDSSDPTPVLCEAIVSHNLQHEGIYML